MNAGEIAKVIQALRDCENEPGCFDCHLMRDDAKRKCPEYQADLIESLQAEVTKWKERHNQAALNFQQENRENAKLQAQLAESQRRADAAVEDLKEALYIPLSIDCEYCKYYGAETEEHIAEAGGCHACENHGGFLVCFEWRGPQEAGEGEAK